MKLLVVTGDDHEYDMMSQWVVGVFSSQELADQAIEVDRRAYRGHLKKRGGPNYETTPVFLDHIVKAEE